MAAVVKVKLKPGAVPQILKSADVMNKALLPAARKIQQRAGADFEVEPPFIGRNRGRTGVRSVHPVGSAGQEKLRNALR